VYRAGEALDAFRTWGCSQPEATGTTG